MYDDDNWFGLDDKESPEKNKNIDQLQPVKIFLSIVTILLAAIFLTIIVQL